MLSRTWVPLQAEVSEVVERLRRSERVFLVESERVQLYDRALLAGVRSELAREYREEERVRFPNVEITILVRGGEAGQLVSK